MYPEDRVLVGVINRAADLNTARHAHWYRIPQDKMPQGIHAEYLAFFLSRAFGDQNGAVHYYARRTGHELARRRDLLPEQANHPRADRLYYKVQLGELREKVPPVVNTDRRPVSFIYTTWDRFVAARQIQDLYSTADAFVDRLHYAFRSAGIVAERIWEAEQVSDDGGAQLCVPCAQGTLIATTATQHEPDRLHLVATTDVKEIARIIAEVRTRIEALGGRSIASAPLES